MESELLPSNEEDFYDDLKSFFAKCDPYINKDIIGILQELLENAKNFKKHCDEYSFSTYHDNFERYELNYLIPFFNDFTKKNLTKKDDFSSKTLIDYDQSIFSPEDFDYNKILYLLYIIRMCQEIISTKRQELINLYNAYHNTNVMNFIDEKFKPYNHFFNYITSFILSKLDLRVFIDTKISFKIKVYEEIGSSSYDPEKTLEKTVKGNFFDIFLFSNQIPITLSEKTNPVKFIENNFYYVVELLKFQPELINIFPFYKFFDDSYEQKEDIVDSIFYVDYNNFCGILTENLDPDSFLKQIEDHFNDVNDTDKEGYYKNVLTFLKNLIEKRHEEMSQERLEKFISAFNQIKEKLTKHKESKKSALSSSIILDEDSEQSSSYTSHTSSEDNDEIILGTDVNSGKNLEDIQKKEEEAFYEIYNNVNKSNEKIYTSEYYTSEYEKKEYHMQHNDEEPESSVPITVKPEKSNEEESSDEDKKSSDKKSNDENKEEDKNENYNPIYEFYIKNIEKNS